MMLSKGSLGICFGAASTGIVYLEKEGRCRQVIIRSENQPHGGRPQQVLTRLESMFSGLKTLKICTTGRESRNTVNLTTIPEAEALEWACRYILPEKHPYRRVISAGGETIMLYILDQNGRIEDARSGSKCASGTGEFFLQQLRRMAIDPDEACRMQVPEKIFSVSGRCSVFCKSDCTHALNSGIPKVQVVAGFSRMMAAKILELWEKLPPQPTLLIGGCSRNSLLYHYLSQTIEDLLIPRQATCFEALGAALRASDMPTRPWPGSNNLLSERRTHYRFLKPLSASVGMVEFKKQISVAARPGDKAILGLDVGSTTTKGVVMRRRDRAILATEYIRTNGDPVGAARATYVALSQQLKVQIKIEGLGITGSGRKIAGLHALSPGVINEISAHAAGAVWFEPRVDTIFEIGGQDAKYIDMTNGIPGSYAMNEACSAGTGSFLEESAREDLGLLPEDLADLALQSRKPPDFSDQCAAFIGSDIKRAIQDGIPRQDIIAGMVYSVCRNYLNRVKGNRPIGERIFMQGGTCYNRAVPTAMAALTGKRIIVPPDPGLIGAFGVALEVERRISGGILVKQIFNLDELAQRKLAPANTFICRGSSDCDGGCEITRFKIDDRSYPFGGSCRRYEVECLPGSKKNTGLDLVGWREKRVFQGVLPAASEDERSTVGMNRSFLLHTYFPFYKRFFSELGFRLVIPESATEKGASRSGAAFCYPAESAHAYAASLLQLKPDFIFLPLVRQASNETENATACTCVFVQGEPFYLRTAFPELKSAKVLTPTLDFARPLFANLPAFIDTVTRMGLRNEQAAPALKAAIREQELFFVDLQEAGKQALEEMSEADANPTIVLFGRPYNSFTGSANQSIPIRFSSRGCRVLPYDLLPYNEQKLADEQNIYWGMGRMLLQAAEFVKRQPHLFAVYITNFSCGPDSFLLSHFRDCMGSKPALILELDNHTAAAGLETRIEAFLDIVQAFRQGLRSSGANAKKSRHSEKDHQLASFALKERKPGVQIAADKWLHLSDERVRVLVPSMSRYGTPLLAGAFLRINVRAKVLPPADPAVLQRGRENSSGKECLPLQTTLGSILEYLENDRPSGEVSVYFMASSEGPCRFGQYHVFSQKVIRRKQFADVALLSPSSLNGYAGLGRRFMLAAWRALVIGDIFDEMWSTLMAAAVDRESGLHVLNREFGEVLSVIAEDQAVILRQLSRSAVKLQKIPLQKKYSEIAKISLVGEIYVRHDPLSLQGLNEYLADQGFIVRTAGNSEWFEYVDWLIRNNIEGRRTLNFRQQLWAKQKIKRMIKNRLAPSGLFYHDVGSTEAILEVGEKFVSPDLTCETILTVGSALHDILDPACGVISIGPFGCMPSRMAEAILNEVLTAAEKRKLTNGRAIKSAVLLQSERRLPFLALETDGNPFPQIIDARLEIFLLQAKRLQSMMAEV